MILIFRKVTRRPDSTTAGTVAVIGNYGNTNLGDKASLTSIIEHVTRRRPRAKIIALSVDPEVTRGRYGVVSYAAWDRHKKPPARADAEPPTGRPSRLSIWTERIRRPIAAIARGPIDLFAWGRELAEEAIFLARCRLAMRGVDLLIVGGGGQIADEFGGPWNFPYRLLVWVAAAKAAGAQVAFVCVGAGSIKSGLSRVFLKAALSMADHRSLRDQRSQRTVVDLGVRRPSVVAADIVFALEAEVPPPPRTPLVRPRVVGFNVFPYHAPFYWPGADATHYHAYLENAARFIEWLGRNGYIVHLFPTQLRADLRVIRDLMATMDARGIRLPATQLIHAAVTDVESLTATVSMMDLVVATRFHAIVMSLRAGTPVLALSSQRKTDDLMADMGLSAYRVSIDDMPIASVVGRFTTLARNAQHVRQQIQARTRELRHELEELMDGLLGLPRSDVDTGPIPTSGTSPRAMTHRPNH